MAIENMYGLEARAALDGHMDAYYNDPRYFVERMVSGDVPLEGDVWEKLVIENGFGMVTELVFKERVAERYEAFGRVIPFKIEERDGTLVMDACSKDGVVTIEMQHLAGLDVVRGDSNEHSYEIDGELLISFTYINPSSQKLEANPRRIRVMGLAYGLDGIRQSDGKFPIHRKLGELDYSLVGQDTQYDPSDPDKSHGARQFPFWRVLGLRGNIHMLNKEGHMINSTEQVMN